MSDRSTTSELAADVRELRKMITELALAQAEAFNALVEYTNRAVGGPSYYLTGQIPPPSLKILRGRVLEAADKSLSIAEALVQRDDG